MKVIEFQGVDHEFPDNFTDAQIQQALRSHGGKQPSAPSTEMPKFDPMANIQRLGEHFGGVTPNAPQTGERRERMGDKLLNYLFGREKLAPYTFPASTESVPDWLKKLEGATNTLDQYTPSATTAATMAIPGLGLGPAALRTAVAGAGHGAESYMAGEADPLKEGGKAALTQGVVEGVAPGLGKAAKFAADLPILGGQTRAIRGLAKAVENAGQKPATPAVAGEYMGKYGPTGIKAGQPLIGGGTAAADVAPVVIPHPTIPGWTALDVLKETLKPAVKRGPQGGGLEALMRLLGTAGGGYANTPDEGMVSP